MRSIETKQQKNHIQYNRRQYFNTFIDLFCGIGGFHYAADELGLECKFASDIDLLARQQYKENFDIDPEGDICDVTANSIPKYDILFAGFPCQPFSIIGSRKGLDDDRGTLIFEICRILKNTKPKAFVLENVRQFASFEKGLVLDRCIQELENCGYYTDWKILNALDFGLPQKRERTIIVGFRNKKILKRFNWPRISSNYKPLDKVLELNPDQRHFVSKRIRDKRKTRHKATHTPSIWHENKGGNIASHPYSCALRAGASHNYLLVNGERRLTPREQLRLQGFPESFQIVGSDSQIRKQTGNAVPVPMVKAVIKEMLNASTTT